MRLLLISDDAKLAKTLKAPLQAAGYQLLTAGPAAAQADDGLPDRIEMVLMDLAHGVPEPGRLCQALRRRPAFKDVPQVLLVPEARVRTLDWRWGANDFLALPAGAEAVLARLQWLLGQLHRVDLSNGLQVGDLVIDFEQFTVSVKGRVVDLTFKEYELLRFLAGHPGKVFTREVLLNKVWGYDFYGGTRTVDVHIRRLRSKIEDARHTFIDTIRHVGYKFLAPDA